MTADQALEVWMTHLAAERRASPRTLEAYRAGASSYLNFLARHRGETITVEALGTVSAAEVRAWLADKREVFNWDRGPDRMAVDDTALQIVAFLAGGLADHIFDR